MKGEIYSARINTIDTSGNSGKALIIEIITIGILIIILIIILLIILLIKIRIKLLKLELLLIKRRTRKPLKQ